MILLCCLNRVFGYTLQVWEGEEYRIPDSTPSPLTLSFQYNASDPEDVALMARIVEQDLSVVVYPETEEPWHVNFANSTLVFSPDDIKNSVNHTFTIISYYWGYFPVMFYGNLAAKSSEIVEGRNVTMLGEKKLLRNDTMVICDRQQSSKTMDTIFMVGAVSFSLFNTVLMGTQLDIQIIIGVIKKPIGPLCGVICQFICMPLAKSSEIVEGRNVTMLGEKKLLRNDTMVICDRQQSSKTMDTIFMIGAVSFSLFNTVLMGTQLDIQIIIGVIKKPIGPLCGVICQFICMPLFSFLVGWLLLDDPLQRLGLFTLGCSPGGQNSNFYTLLFNGDINLSITMTFCSTIIAMGMMPTWMFLLGSRLLGPDSSITIPYTKLITSLITFSIPLFIGLLIKHKLPRWARFAGRIVKPLTFCMITYFITFGMYNQYKGMALITWNVALAGLLVAGCGYSVGALLSAVCCLKKKQIIAISIETAFQNAAIAYLLLKLSLGTPAR
ncbi:Bile acid:sodium symporter/arsenical resistance protein Acr3 [Trinorchestia longiramus]|nr:Bile acid:sodium symporter/arsenical resistance protein Acr3 [Trinorchestia longiramus]